MTIDNRDIEFIDKVREKLDESVEHLDAGILSRLSRARDRALENSGKKRRHRRRPYRLALAVGVTAAFVVFMVVFKFQTPEPQLYSGIEDVELLATSDNPEFFTELDFYTWLAEAMGDAG
jgi:hypothetical protein